MLLQNRLFNLMIVLLMFTLAEKSNAQELFVISEPASNLPSNALSFRLTDKFMNGHRHVVSGRSDTIFMQRIVPEIAIG